MKNLLQPEKWVSNHSDYLYRYTRARVFNEDDALDFVQETFLSAWKARETFKGDSSERTWLTSILKRKIIDYYRKKATGKESGDLPPCDEEAYFQETGFFAGHWKKDKAPKEWAFSEDAMETNELQKILNKCLSMLPASLAACFTLKAIEEYSSEEVCKELNISPSNLWTSMHRAKLQMRNCMEINWFGNK